MERIYHEHFHENSRKDRSSQRKNVFGTGFCQARPTPAASASPRVIKDERVQKDDRAFNRAPVPSAPKAISDVGVVANLEKLAVANPARLDWKVSIVELLKLLGLDGSFNARKELAVELSCPADMMNDSAKMNTWLHKTVLKKIAENGGNIPKALLD